MQLYDTVDLFNKWSQTIQQFVAREGQNGPVDSFEQRCDRHTYKCRIKYTHDANDGRDQMQVYTGH